MEVRVNRVRDARFEIRSRDVSVIVDRLEEQDGPGDGFRPVELFLGSLGACMLGTMLTFAENQQIPVGDVSLVLEPVIEEHPEHIARVDMKLLLEGDLSERQLQSLQRVGQACKIHNTLHRVTETVLTVERARSGTGSSMGDS